MVWIVAAVAAVSIFYALFFRSPLRRAIALNLAAQHACKRRDYAGALRFCRESYETAGQLKEPQKSQIQAKIEIQWATLLYRQGDIHQAEEMFQRGFQHARETGCYPEMKPAFLVWGNLCADVGRHLEAEQHYRLALQGEEQTGNLAGLIFALQRLGDSLIRQERRQEAEEVLNRAIVLETQVVHEQMVRQGKNPANHRIISFTLPDLHFCREQYEDARRLYKEKVEFWERSVTRPDNIDLGHLQMRLASAEARTGHPAEAVEMYTRAEKTFEREWGSEHPKAIAAREAKAVLTREMVGVSGE
jgi:tetratricopeptide (TPR) repeat protein